MYRPEISVRTEYGVSSSSTSTPSRGSPLANEMILPRTVPPMRSPIVNSQPVRIPSSANGYISSRCNVHVPVPEPPLNVDKGSTGEKDPLNGGLPLTMEVAALSSKYVSMKLSPDPPALDTKVTI